MLKQLSYLNIFLAMTYTLLFITAYNLLLIVGIGILVLFNVLVIKKIQEEGRFDLILGLLATGCLCFWAYLALGCTYVVQFAIDHRYYADVWSYLIPTGVFLLVILLQLILCFRYFRKHQAAI
ncbi:hypothetical protein [Pedobacter gandavensis]|uniref:hypothetical protein n=1 Tax=Pedobacter gandavensis TaxID=2679963 RepID=UPI002930B2C1|nr:hypothetical protein [Pedobacter gandavensis]